MEFLAAVRRGERSLGASYWLYWLAGNTVLLMATFGLFAVTLFADPHRPPSASPTTLLALLVFGVTLIFIVTPFYAISSSLGVIRSAQRYLAAEERPMTQIVLARLAQFHAATGFVAAFLPMLVVVLLIQSPAPQATPG